MSIKIERINSNLMKEISYILATEINDEDIKFVTVTDCKVTNDLSFAKVYITILNDQRREATLKALEKAQGFIRRNLSERIFIRHLPKLHFVYDESIATGKKIENIIEQMHDK
ncbi:MAG: 30S ribosome-binding factor RbfA [Bacilli bacterium]